MNPTREHALLSLLLHHTRTVVEAARELRKHGVPAGEIARVAGDERMAA